MQPIGKSLSKSEKDWIGITCHHIPDEFVHTKLIGEEVSGRFKAYKESDEYCCRL